MGCHPGAAGDYLSAEFKPRRNGPAHVDLGRFIQTLSDSNIREIYSRSFHPDQNVPIAGNRIGMILEFQAAVAPWAVNDDFFHWILRNEAKKKRGPAILANPPISAR